MVVTTTILHDARLIDGTGAGPVPDAVVVIDDGKITYAGSASGAPQVDDSSDPVRVDVGVRDALVAGTQTSAELCGVEATLGTLEAGKLAINRGGFPI